MAIALVASVSATPGANGGTTAAIDTTGATLLVVSVSSYGGSGAPTLTDSKGNTYTGLTERTQAANVRHRLFYCLTPTVGTGHTFTASGTNSYPAFVADAFSGVASYQVESGTTAGGTTSLASGSVTPSANGALIVTGVCGQNAVTDSVTPAGFTLTQKTFSSGVNMQGSAAWLVQTTAAAINPTWGFSPAQGNIAIGSAVFLAAVAGTEGRVSQLAVETLSLPSAPARVSQLVVEVLGTSLSVAAPGRVTQLAVETLQPVPPPDAQVSQLAVETLQPLPPIPLRATHLFVEVFVPLIAALRTTHTVVEFFQGRPARLAATQAIVEIFRDLPPNTCPLDFPIDPDDFPLE